MGTPIRTPKTEHRRYWRIALVFSGATIIALLAYVNAGVRFDWHWHSKKEAPRAANTTTPLPVPIEKPRDIAEAFPGISTSTSRTPQPLILVGTQPGRTPQEGTAMIGVSRANPQTFGVGSVLANGARLTEIHEKYVVLERSAQRVRLYLQDTPQANDEKARTADILMVGGAAPPIARPAAPSVDTLTEYLRFNPVYDNGDLLRGYEVYPGRKSTVFSQMGLSPGDVLVEANGSPLMDATQANDIFKSLMNGITVTATVIRKEKTLTVKLDGALIAADQEREANAAKRGPTSESVPPI